MLPNGGHLLWIVFLVVTTLTTIPILIGLWSLVIQDLQYTLYRMKRRAAIRARRAPTTTDGEAEG